MAYRPFFSNNEYNDSTSAKTFQFIENLAFIYKLITLTAPAIWLGSSSDSATKFTVLLKLYVSTAVADPGFYWEGGANFQSWWGKHIFLVENCMEMKEFGPQARIPGVPLRFAAVLNPVGHHNNLR